MNDFDVAMANEQIKIEIALKFDDIDIQGPSDESNGNVIKEEADTSSKEMKSSSEQKKSTPPAGNSQP